jgi:hypothetical protein
VTNVIKFEPRKKPDAPKPPRPDWQKKALVGAAIAAFFVIVWAYYAFVAPAQPPAL